MKSNLCLLWAGIAIFVLTGCSTIVTEKAVLSAAPKGVRIYPPAVYFLVDTTEKKTTIAYLPDYQRAYDVKPLTILAKQDFKVDLDEGQLKSLTANQDTTAFLSFLKEAGVMAAKAAGVGVSSTVISGTFGLTSGVYRLGDDGKLAVQNQP